LLNLAEMLQQFVRGGHFSHSTWADTSLDFSDAE